MKKLLLTFDYELFLGKLSGRPEDCMIRPTEALLAAMAPYEAKGLFFVDATYLWHLAQQSESYPQAAKDFNLIAAQIKAMVKEGHEIGLHLHPHWLDAHSFDEGRTWNLENKRYYRFHKLSETQRAEVFQGALGILEKIVSEADPSARIRSYRGGGWSIQPFGDFAPFFEEAGIQLELSVRPGFASFTDAQFYDFSQAPEAWCYRFSRDECHPDPEGHFVELPITSVEISPQARKRNNLRNRIAWKLLKERTYGQGIGTLPQVQANPPAPNGKLKPKTFEMAAIELLTRFTLPAYLCHFQAHPGMQFISHPKMITEHNLSTFQKFLKKIHRSHPVNGNAVALLSEAGKA